MPLSQRLIIKGANQSDNFLPPLSTRYTQVKKVKETKIEECDDDNRGHKLSPNEFVAFLLKHESLADEFCYMNRYHDYKFEIVPYSSVNKNDYYTISTRGVTRYVHGRVKFTPVDEWLGGLKLYDQIKKIEFFRNISMYKKISMWKANMTINRMRSIRNSLSRNLLQNSATQAVIPSTLLDIKHILCMYEKEPPVHFRSMLSYLVTQDVTIRVVSMNLDDFYSNMEANFNRMLVLFVADIDKVLDLIINCAATSLIQFFEFNGFNLDNLKNLLLVHCRAKSTQLCKRLDVLAPSKYAGALEFDISSVSYTEIAAMKTICAKVLRFIRLTELMYANSIRELILHSLEAFINSLEEFSKCLSQIRQQLVDDIKQVASSPEIRDDGEHGDDITDEEHLIQKRKHINVFNPQTFYKDPKILTLWDKLDSIAEFYNIGLGENWDRDRGGRPATGSSSGTKELPTKNLDHSLLGANGLTTSGPFLSFNIDVRSTKTKKPCHLFMDSSDQLSNEVEFAPSVPNSEYGICFSPPIDTFIDRLRTFVMKTVRELVVSNRPFSSHFSDVLNFLNKSSETSKENGEDDELIQQDDINSYYASLESTIQTGKQQNAIDSLIRSLHHDSVEFCLMKLNSFIDWFNQNCAFIQAQNVQPDDTHPLDRLTNIGENGEIEAKILFPLVEIDKIPCDQLNKSTGTLYLDNPLHLSDDIIIESDSVEARICSLLIDIKLLEKILLLFKTQKDEITRLTQSIVFGPFTFDLETFASRILPSPVSCLEYVERTIPTYSNMVLSCLIDSLNFYTRKLSLHVDNVDSYATHVHSVRFVKTQILPLYNHVINSNLNDLNDMIYEQNLKIDLSIKNKFRYLLNTFRSLENLVTYSEQTNSEVFDKYVSQFETEWLQDGLKLINQNIEQLSQPEIYSFEAASHLSSITSKVHANVVSTLAGIVKNAKTYRINCFTDEALAGECQKEEDSIPPSSSAKSLANLEEVTVQQGVPSTQSESALNNPLETNNHGHTIQTSSLNDKFCLLLATYELLRLKTSLSNAIALNCKSFIEFESEFSNFMILSNTSDIEKYSSTVNTIFKKTNSLLTQCMEFTDYCNDYSLLFKDQTTSSPPCYVKDGIVLFSDHQQQQESPQEFSINVERYYQITMESFKLARIYTDVSTDGENEENEYLYCPANLLEIKRICSIYRGLLFPIVKAVCSGHVLKIQRHLSRMCEEIHICLPESEESSIDEIMSFLLTQLSGKFFIESVITGVNNEPPIFTRETLSKVSDVSTNASNESSIYDMFIKITKVWETTSLILNSTSGGAMAGVNDKITLGSNEETIQLIEDSLVSISTVMSSKYAAPFLDTVVSWRYSLVTMSEIFEELQSLQRNYLYLETIFTSSDIKKQLPTESALFVEVEADFTNIFKEFSKNPNVFYAFIQILYDGEIEKIQQSFQDDILLYQQQHQTSTQVVDGETEQNENQNPTDLMNNAINELKSSNHLSEQNSLLLKLKKTNENLEEISKGLDDYLQSKRFVFPRFFFLSNDELIHIMSQSNLITTVIPHLRKCFDNVFSLEYSPPTSSLTTDVNIDALVSGEGEVIRLWKALRPRGGVEKWLGELEGFMRRSLKDSIKSGLKSRMDFEALRDDKIQESKNAVYRAIHEADVTGDTNTIDVDSEEFDFLSNFLEDYDCQAITVNSMIKFAVSIEDAISAESKSLNDHYSNYLKFLDNLIVLVRQVGTNPGSKKSASVMSKTLVSLITQEVHNRDIIEKLISNNVTDLSNFNWTAQLRFYFDFSTDLVRVCQINASIPYGYEYEGPTNRLVITPLTDRCWITITGALNLCLGAAPAGPAGTGKTESTKDLAKAIARLCVVFNCSDQIDYKMMAKLFSGVIATGGWTCLDEFNRISIEVLSVVATQISVLRNALLAKQNTMEFEGNSLHVGHSCGIFITMNPGYAGRTELPDNLKVLFRPVSMMVPDYTLIAEIMLFAEGFSTAKKLSAKFTKLFKLCSEQLSSQDHYDFGMRAVKSVLVMAGSLKRKSIQDQQQQETSDNTVDVTEEEEILLIRAMVDSNLPKFVKEDIVLFKGIVGDLFPALSVSVDKDHKLFGAVSASLRADGLNPAEISSTSVGNNIVMKCTQLRDTLNVRFGVMLVGGASGGKTTVWKHLCRGLNILKEKALAGASSPVLGEEPSYDCDIHTPFKGSAVSYTTINPKSVTMGELYGEFSQLTMEWRDGIASKVMRDVAHLTSSSNNESSDMYWTIFDGPVDAIWIESMNTVLDDNMTLCLANGERVKLTNRMRMLFEVENLKVASPATVSRCGMVYLDNSIDLTWQNFILSFFQSPPHLDVIHKWRNRILSIEFGDHPPMGSKLTGETVESAFKKFYSFVTSSLLNSKLIDYYMVWESNTKSSSATFAPIFSSIFQKIEVFCRLCLSQFSAFLSHLIIADCKQLTDIHDPYDEPAFKLILTWCFVYSFSIDLDQRAQTKFDEWLASLKTQPGLEFLLKSSKISSCFIDYNSLDYIEWSNQVEPFENKITKVTPYSTIFVPTEDSLKVLYCMEKHLLSSPAVSLLLPRVSEMKGVFLSGNSGVGKSAVLSFMSSSGSSASATDCMSCAYRTTVFSAKTTAAGVVDFVHGALEKKRKNLLASWSSNESTCLIVDDVNLPISEEYGAIPSIELIRQVYSRDGGFYDHSVGWISLDETSHVNLICAAAPPGGGRRDLGGRFGRLLANVCFADPNINVIQSIFTSILNEKFRVEGGDLSQVNNVLSDIVLKTTGIYEELRNILLPTPSRSHYLFNLRDLSRIFHGVCHGIFVKKGDSTNLPKIWANEVNLVFRHRLIDIDDRKKYDEVFTKISNVNLDVDGYTLLFKNTLRPYTLSETAVDNDQVLTFSGIQSMIKKTLTELDEDVVDSPGCSYVFFKDFLSHIIRVGSILSKESSHALLIGVPGCGRRTVLKVVCSLLKYEYSSIEVKKGYNINVFKEDLKEILIKSLSGGGPDSITPAPSIGSEDFISELLADETSLFESFDDYWTLCQQNVGDDSHVVFGLDENQIVQDSFLEVVNSLLSRGSVPNLWTSDDISKINTDIIEPMAKARWGDELANSLLGVNLNKVSLKLMERRLIHQTHVVLTISPVGEKLRLFIRNFPSIVNCTTIDWFDNWPKEALCQIALEKLNNKLYKNEYIDDIANFFESNFSRIVDNIVPSFENESRFKVFVTPKSFLDMVDLFSLVKDWKYQDLNIQMNKLSRGVSKLDAAKADVDSLQKELEALQPVLIKKSEETDELMKTVTVEADKAKIVQTGVEEEEAIVRGQKEEVEAIQKSAQADLDKALPALEAAIKSLDALDKNDITEVKSFKKPPPLVTMTLEAVCVLLGEKTDWDSGKKVLSESGFMDRLKKFDKDNISATVFKKLDKYIQKEEYTPEKVGNQSKAAKCLCLWTHAMHTYYLVAREVEPKKQKLADMNVALEEANSKLEAARSNLKKILDQVAELQAKLDGAVAEKNRLKEESDLTANRLDRASILTVGLADEGVRWAQSVESMKVNVDHVDGDCAIVTLCLALYGPFSGKWRHEIFKNSFEYLKSSKCEIADALSNVDLDAMVGNPIDIRQWTSEWGLPSDKVSVNSGISVMNKWIQKYPLLLDPQEQATTWLKRKYESMEDVQLQVIKSGHPKFGILIENAIRAGHPILIEDIKSSNVSGGGIDPMLAPVLYAKEIGAKFIQWGDSQIDLDYTSIHQHFTVYFSCRSGAPIFNPDVFISTNVINFGVTFDGLSEQLLDLVVSIEKPKLTLEKTELSLSIYSSKLKLRQIEDEILRLLVESECENILDDVQLIETLKSSKITSTEIGESLIAAEAAKIKIDEAFTLFSGVSKRAAILYFVTNSLSRVDSMYQFSLDYFRSLYSKIIKSTDENRITDDADNALIEKRVSTLVSVVSSSIFINICRSLFKKDKILFSFLFSLSVERDELLQTTDTLIGLLFGTTIPSSIYEGKIKNKNPPTEGVEEEEEHLVTPDESPDDTWISLANWQTIYALSVSLDELKLPGDFNLAEHIYHHVDDWRYWSSVSSDEGLDEVENSLSRANSISSFGGEDPFAQYSPTESHLWLPIINSVGEELELVELPYFYHLCLTKILSPEKLITCVNEYVSRILKSSSFTDFKASAMRSVYDDSSCTCPILFVLSSGADPTDSIYRLASELGQREKLAVISLGQGQGPKATKLIESATINGSWALLQNVHLARSWLPNLSRIIENIEISHRKNASAIHSDFRLFLTSFPATYFPVNVLQSSLKITNEPPDGIRANLLRTMEQMKDNDLKLIEEIPDNNVHSPKSIDSSFKYGEEENDDIQSSPESLTTSLSDLKWKRLQVSLKLFHAVIQERRKFGPLGWNIAYEFNDSDLEVSHQNMKEFVLLSTESSDINYDTLSFVIGDINYGGRVTDEFDRRCLQTILSRFINANCANQYGYDFTSETIIDIAEGGNTLANESFAVVSDNDIQSFISPYILPNTIGEFHQVSNVVEWINTCLPTTDSTDIFGLHQNAYLTYQSNIGKKLLEVSSSVSSGSSSSSSTSASSSDDSTMLMAMEYVHRLPEQIDLSNSPDFQVIMSNPLSVTLRQEIDRFNALLKEIKKDLTELSLAISGTIVFTNVLDEILQCVRLNLIPKSWESLNFACLKSFSSWFTDLTERVNFFRSWWVTMTSSDTHPDFYCLSAFYFPQGFLTAVLQSHSRQTGIAIDNLDFSFEMLGFDSPDDVLETFDSSGKPKATIGAGRKASIDRSNQSSAVSSDGSYVGMNDEVRSGLQNLYIQRNPTNSFSRSGRLITGDEETPNQTTNSTQPTSTDEQTVVRRAVGSVDHSGPKPKLPGAIIYGLFMDGFRWDYESCSCEDQLFGVTYLPAPAIYFIPCVKEHASDQQSPRSTSGDEIQLYSAPLYKTSVRAGTLSTTGHSTNFVLCIDIPTLLPPKHWILRGAALLTMLDD